MIMTTDELKGMMYSYLENLNWRRGMTDPAHRDSSNEKNEEIAFQITVMEHGYGDYLDSGTDEYIEATRLLTELYEED